MDFSDYGTNFLIHDCGDCGYVTIRIPHQLLADMLKNCKESANKSMFLNNLSKIKKSFNLDACLKREKIL